MARKTRTTNAASAAEATPAASPSTASALRVKPKTAVVLIHGMGEQRPMSTLWGFVEAAWSSDRNLVPEFDNAVYAKPDTINDNFDLRRVTTRYWIDPHPRRVDFFEFYWAHLMQGNTVRSTLGWVRDLFIRPPSSVPRGLRRVWLFGLVLLLVGAAFMIVAALPSAVTDLFITKPIAAGVALGSVLLSLAATGWLAPVAGDAARYFSADPPNVEARNAIRRAGVEVLERLAKSGTYDRIILVGHSLGSAIGLDILAAAYERVPRETWAKAHPKGGQAALSLKALEKAADQLKHKPKDRTAFIAYRDAQRAYAAMLARGWETGDAPWLVSDYVTLGSPLSKAEILITRNRERFDFRVGARGLPTCPPFFEQTSPPRFSYEVARGQWGPHHAAPFASTIWTNLYFSNTLIVIGDIVSGLVAPLFGPGVRDVRLPIGAPKFRHNDYWLTPEVEPTPPWIKALRRALNLRLEPEAHIWDQATTDTMLADRPDHMTPKA